MSKGMYTQGLCVLLERPVSLDAIQAALGSCEIRRRLDTISNWEFGGPSLILAYRPEVNGFVSVDIVDRPWPDHMGDPQAETTLFGAWSMGHFGPYAYPNGLARAGQQCWGWSPGRTIAQRHRAFLRIRLSYAFGAADDDPIIPQDYRPLPELEFVTEIAFSLLKVPGALCYYNPNGELLRDRDGLRETLDYARAHGFPPLDAWSNCRMFNVDSEWSLMDTVGNAQLDIPDVEACFHSKSFDFGEIDRFLRNVSLYVLNHGEVIRDGDTMDGPGGMRWQARSFKNGICDPPRRVLRWFSLDGRSAPEVIANAEQEETAGD